MARITVPYFELAKVAYDEAWGRVWGTWADLAHTDGNPDAKEEAFDVHLKAIRAFTEASRTYADAWLRAHRGQDDETRSPYDGKASHDH